MNFPPRQVAVLFKFTFPPAGSLHPVTFSSVCNGTSPLPQFGTPLKGHLSLRAPCGLAESFIALHATLTSGQSWFPQSHPGALENTPQETAAPISLPQTQGPDLQRLHETGSLLRTSCRIRCIYLPLLSCSTPLILSTVLNRENLHKFLFLNIFN